VVILQRRLPHYRTAFFSRLRERCKELGIQVELVYSKPSEHELTRNDSGDLSWAIAVDCLEKRIAGRELVWQQIPARVRSADLIVLSQENRLLSNLPFLFWPWRHRAKLAYWGHGANFQSDAPMGLRERFKRLMVHRVDWWFAYTSMTRDYLHSLGFPERLITTVDNATDTEGFKANLERVCQSDIDALRHALALAPGDVIGLFCGSLYKEKRLAYLVAACDDARARGVTLKLLVVGDGPERPELERMAATRSWVHVLGFKSGHEKAVVFRTAHLMLNPGLAGLHIVDAFCAGLPFITLADSKHSPEISYLEHGRNALIVNGGPDVFGAAIASIVADESRLRAICAEALADSSRFTLTNMVERFAHGIQACLRSR
jgi:glycosyltransferase involved in cell wall biosynthesis